MIFFISLILILGSALEFSVYIEGDPILPFLSLFLGIGFALASIVFAITQK